MDSGKTEESKPRRLTAYINYPVPTVGTPNRKGDDHV